METFDLKIRLSLTVSLTSVIHRHNVHFLPLRHLQLINGHGVLILSALYVRWRFTFFVKIECRFIDNGVYWPFFTKAFFGGLCCIPNREGIIERKILLLCAWSKTCSVVCVNMLHARLFISRFSGQGSVNMSTDKCHAYLLLECHNWMKGIELFAYYVYVYGNQKCRMTCFTISALKWCEIFRKSKSVWIKRIVLYRYGLHRIM